jgi:hypothetical protein
MGIRLLLVVLGPRLFFGDSGNDPLLSDDGEVFSGFLEVLVLIAGVGLGGITVVVGLGAMVGALVRRRNDARVVR